MPEKPLPEVSASVMTKAKKYLTDGRVSVVHLDPEAFVTPGSTDTQFRATVQVQGSDPTTPYEVQVWDSIVKCGCPARVWACAHLVASLLILDVPHPSEVSNTTSLAGGSLEALIGDPEPQDDPQPPPDPETVAKAEAEVESVVERELREERAREIDRLLGL